MKNSVAYQNKDIISKVFGESMRNKSFRAYRMDIPEIVEILPTNLPAVEANEMRLDNLFRLKDGTIVIVDYESTYSYADKIKYLNYVARTTKRYGLSEKQNQPVRMIVIYTGSIRRGTTRADVDMGCLQFTVEEVFLSDLDAQEIETRFQRKIHSGEILSDEEQMQFIILPLVHKTKEEMQDCIVRCFEMVKKIDSPEIQRFLLSGLIVFTDKVIRREDSERIKRWIEMTKVGRLFEEEKQKAVQEAIKKEKADKKKALQRASADKERALQKAAAERKQELLDEKISIARKFLMDGIPVDSILKCIDGLDRAEIEALK